MAIREEKIAPDVFLKLVETTSAFINKNVEVFGVSNPLDLPSRTHNGKIEPKVETLQAFRRVEDAICRLDVKGDYVRYPINIRIKGGYNEGEDKRPYSTAKPHTDIWAGDPANSFVHIIPLFGDLDGNGMRFADPEIIDLDGFNKQHPNYEDGVKTVGEINWLDLKMQPQHLYVVDPKCVHQTMQKNGVFRISIDFRNLYGKPQDAAYAKLYIPIEDFKKKRFETNDTAEQTIEKYVNPNHIHTA